ncbi:hypothetical protein SDRG_11241 [Saprolegnia diclina VS20]|uniref:Uncharacterized protein n=1 Tax=Saprolegnia diclina (strain VS20) TaxID=1156394 RepID=T0QBZ3_SAPDV|nr:hypothetical protein SDRG_11241 [Saprolegnia diclina VS20]EQC31055.1 hypothetical protein SDRG_11241 [Saprolegnia diclina VS20]|eukprot:XP_008615494.1 hypothetical protein SDRG_11241 [Saprolegnia diclina VS20]
MATGPRKDKSARPISSIGQSSFQLHATHEASSADDASVFDIKQFLLEKKSGQPSYAASGLFRTNTRDFAEAVDAPLSFTRVLKKKQLPRMTQARSTPTLPKPGSTANAINQSSDAEHSVGYRIYSIENMMDASLHAIRSLNKTWQTLRTSDLRLECPSKRSDVVDLENCFDAAMSYASGHINWDGNRQTALIDRDYMSVQSHVSAQYVASVSEAEVRQLTTMVFEQKWADITIGELEAMLMVSFLEQGTLLRKVRIQYAMTYANLETLLGESLVVKARAVQAEADMRAKLESLGHEHTAAIAALRFDYEHALEALRGEMEHERGEADRKVQDARDQVAKMSETMKTLNGIFKQMREDSDKVRAMELKEANQKLEKRCDALKDEVDRLRSLIPRIKVLEMTTEAQTSQIQGLERDLADAHSVIAEKEAIIEDLLHRQEQLLARLEIQASKGKPEPDASPATDDGAALCRRCRGSLDDDGDDGAPRMATASAGADDNMAGSGYAPTLAKPREQAKRVHCQSFRILLPNLQGRRPTREVSWTLGCIRSLLAAKMEDDGICFLGNLSGRLRMAEFVYTWFSPLETELSLLSPDQRDHAYARADEARWCLYYGAKVLSKDCVEAKLFLSFLDEKHGDDELVFALYCLRALDALERGELRWSPLRRTPHYEAFASEWTAHASITGEIVQVPRVVWIPLTLASQATAIVLIKATAEERVDFDLKLKALSVSTLPDGESSASLNETPPFVDAHHWLQLMLQEYREEQAHRRAAIRLMFQTASSNHAPANDANDDVLGHSSNAEMDMEQFRAMMLTLQADVSCATIVSYFRLSYDRGGGHVTFDAFIDTAEERQFFAQCMCLASPGVLAAPRINSPHAHLGSLVAKHYTLYENDLYALVSTLPPYTQALARQALAETSGYLREGRGAVIDGFRALAAYHRAATFHLWHWLTRTELSGTFELPPTALRRLDKLLVGDLDATRDGPPHATHHAGERLLSMVRKKLAIHRLQRAFRARLKRDQGVPLNMRELMHDGYGSGKTSYRSRHVVRSTKWLLCVISDLIRARAEVEESSDHQPFIEFVYDYFMARFGSRWEAEKVIHDVFVNTRTLVMSHARILLFSQLCGMGASGEDVYYGSPQAFNFINMVLHAGYHTFPLLHPDVGTEYEYVKHEDAVCLIQAFFGSVDVENHDRMLGRLRELEHMSLQPKTSDADGLLLFLLEEWRRHVLDRMGQVRVMCIADKDLLASDGYLSLDQLLVVFRRSGLSVSEVEGAQVLRKVLQGAATATTASTPHLSMLDRIVAHVFPIACHEIAISELQLLPPPNFGQLVYLLMSFWAPYEASGKSLLDELKAIGVKNDVEHAMKAVDASDALTLEQNRRRSRLSVLVKADHFAANDALDLEDKFKAVQHKMQRLIVLQNGQSDESIGLAHVTEATVAFRQYLSEATRLRAVAKLGMGPLPDSTPDDATET